ncbi:MAG TPA: hypothetical protein VGC54_07465 [Planctomycetota bacterium]
MSRNQKGPLQLLYEHVYVVALVTLASVAAAWLVSAGMDPVYKSRAKGFLPTAQEGLSLTSEAPNLPSGPQLPVASTEVQDSLIGILKSTDLRGRVSQKLADTGVDRGTLYLRKNVDFEVDKFNFVVITAWDKEPLRAKETAQIYMEVLRDHLRTVTKESVARKRLLFENEVTKSAAELQAAETELVAFKMAAGRVDYTAELEMTASRIERLRGLRDENDVNLETFDGAIAGRRAQLLARPDEFQETSRSRVQNPLINQYRSEIESLDAKILEKMISEGLTEEHPDVVPLIQSRNDVRERYAEAAKEPFVLGTVGLTPDPIRIDLEGQIIQLELERSRVLEQRAYVQAQLDEAITEFHRLPEYKAQEELLDRRVLEIQTRLADARSRVNETRLFQALEPNYIQDIESPAIPNRPSLPNLGVNLGAAALLGLVLGLTIVVLIDRVRAYREIAPW